MCDAAPADRPALASDDTIALMFAALGAARAPSPVRLLTMILASLLQGRPAPALRLFLPAAVAALVRLLSAGLELQFRSSFVLLLLFASLPDDAPRLLVDADLYTPLLGILCYIPDASALMLLKILFRLVDRKGVSSDGSPRSNDRCVDYSRLLACGTDMRLTHVLSFFSLSSIILLTVCCVRSIYRGRPLPLCIPPSCQQLFDATDTYPQDPEINSILSICKSYSF
jgi:hypothetical protein